MNRLCCAQLKMIGQSVISSTVKQSMRSPTIVTGCILSISFLFFSFLGYEIFLKNSRINYSALNKTIAHLEQTVQEQKKVLSTLQIRLKNIRKSAENTEKLIKKSKLNKIINNIFKLCALYHVNIDSYDVKEKANHEFYIEQSILIEFEGLLQDITQLLNKIKKMNVPVVFDDVILAIYDRKKSVNINVIMKLYLEKNATKLRKNKAHSLVLVSSDPTEPRPLGSGNPEVFARSSESVGETTTEAGRGRLILSVHYPDVSLDSLYFVGILRQGQTIWALIKKPDGSIAFVAPGDFIGQEHGKIVLITDEFIRIQVHSPIDKESIKKIMTLRLKRASE
jgi:Tfp pilus assembly protein PilO